MTINDKIKTAIKKQGYTISSVAAKMRNDRTGSTGISQPALSDMLRGNIPFSRVEEIATIIGLDVIDVIQIYDDGARCVCPHCGQPITIETKIR